MSRRKKRQESQDKAEIDLTPMLDVVFIMLIFFIVTATFVKEKAIDVNVPEDTEEEQQNPKDSAIMVRIDANDNIFVDGRRVDVRAVRSLVAQKHAEKPDVPVVVRAHEEATAEAYVDVADAAREAKVNAVSLVPYRDEF